jgi:hypothetical protein
MCFSGKKVDVITSSKVLAERDSKESKDFLNWFCLDSENNCDELA